MTIAHKRQNNLESMSASFTGIPKVPSDLEKEKKAKDRKAEKAID